MASILPRMANNWPKWKAGYAKCGVPRPHKASGKALILATLRDGRFHVGCHREELIELRDFNYHTDVGLRGTQHHAALVRIGIGSEGNEIADSRRIDPRRR